MMHHHQRADDDGPPSCNLIALHRLQRYNIDGTATVMVVLAGALLDACEVLLGRGIYPRLIAISCFLKAAEICVNNF